MKFLLGLLALLALAYWYGLLDVSHFDSVEESLNNTIERTSDFVTDRAVKEADF